MLLRPAGGARRAGPGLAAAKWRENQSCKARLCRAISRLAAKASRQAGSLRPEPVHDAEEQGTHKSGLWKRRGSARSASSRRGKGSWGRIAHRRHLAPRRILGHHVELVGAAVHVRLHQHRILGGVVRQRARACGAGVRRARGAGWRREGALQRIAPGGWRARGGRDSWLGRSWVGGTARWRLSQCTAGLGWVAQHILKARPVQPPASPRQHRPSDSSPPLLPLCSSTEQSSSRATLNAQCKQNRFKSMVNMPTLVVGGGGVAPDGDERVVALGGKVVAADIPAQEEEAGR